MADLLLDTPGRVGARGGRGWRVLQSGEGLLLSRPMGGSRSGGRSWAQADRRIVLRTPWPRRQEANFSRGGFPTKLIHGHSGVRGSYFVDAQPAPFPESFRRLEVRPEFSAARQDGRRAIPREGLGPPGRRELAVFGAGTAACASLRRV